MCIQALTTGRAMPDDQWRALAPGLNELEISAARQTADTDDFAPTT